MNVAKNVFLRIISKVHQKISSDNEENYDEDSTKMLFPRNKETLSMLSSASESAAVLYIRKKLINFMIVYDAVAFCIRFDKECTLKDVNMRLLASSLDDLPSSTGEPHFLYQTTEETTGWGLNVSDYDDNGSPVEIFPLCDFEHVCFYTARIPGQYSQNSSISSSITTIQSPSSQSNQSSNSNLLNQQTNSQFSPQFIKQYNIIKDELHISRSLMQNIKTTIKLSTKDTKALSQEKPSSSTISKEFQNKKQEEQDEKSQYSDNNNNNEEEESDFVLGQRPNATESSSDEFISQENEEIRNALLQQRQLVHLQEEQGDNEEEEEQYYEQYVGPIQSNPQLNDQRTPPGFFTKYLSSSDSSSLPSSLFDDQFKQ